MSVARRLRARGDRAATLVEYALIVALVVVVSLGAITRLQTSGRNELTASGTRAGSSPDGAYYPGGSTSTTSPSGTTTTTTGSVAVQPSSLTASPPATNDGNKWIANATVTVTTTSSPFTGVAGAIVAGEWTLPDGGSTFTTSCTTTAPAGTCSVQRTDIGDNKVTAVFTITSITSPTFTWTPGPGDATTVTVACPGSPATCD